MTGLLKNLGIILIIIAAVLLILCAFVVKDLADYNWYTWGSMALMVIGLVLHIVINKRLAP